MAWDNLYLANRGGNTFILTGNKPSASVDIFDVQGNKIYSLPASAGTGGHENGGRAKKFTLPGPIPPGGYFVVDGNKYNVADGGRQEYSSGKSDPYLNAADTKGGGGGFGGGAGVAGGIFADTSGLFAPQITAKEIENRIQQIFETADKAGGRNKQILLDAFTSARGIASDNLADEKTKLTDINDFNAAEQGKAFALAAPQGKNILDNGLKTLEAFSKGRLPDAVENEILNQATRAQAATQSSIVGGGISSSFGQRVNSQLNIAQRIGLQETALSRAPQFLANAIELRRGVPQKIMNKPNEVGAIADKLTNLQAVNPEFAINSEFQNISNQTNVDKYNEENRRYVEEFNQTSAAKFQETLLGYDLFNQREGQNFVQNSINAQNDANTIAGGKNIAGQEQEANAASAENASTGDIIGGLGTAAGAIISAYGEDDTGEEGTSTTTDTPTTTSAPVIVNPSPQPTSTPINSTGTTVASPPPEPVASTVLPDGSPGVINSDGSTSPDYNASIDNVEPEVDTNTRSAYRSAKLDVPPATYTRSQTTNTFQDTDQIKSHRAARANTAKSIEPSFLTSDQITYKDGSTGFDINKPVTDLKTVRSPVPVAIHKNLKGGDVKIEASNRKAIIKAHDTKSRIPRADFNAPVYKNAKVSSSSYKSLQSSDKTYKDLGDQAFGRIMKDLETTPFQALLPRTANGEVDLNVNSLIDLAYTNLVGDK